ncbi:hypothetical protein GOODEAATRI_031803, partial [Goodea atripinnis]
MQLALRRLSVLPLWFRFGPSSSSFESTYLTSPSLPRFPVRLCWQPLDSILSPLDSVCKETPNQSSDLWEGSVNQSNQANQAYQTQNHIPPANQLHLQT